MKRSILPVLGLALFLSIPAISQDEAKPSLDKQVEELTKKVEEQDKAMKELRTYVEQQKMQAARLARSLASAEEGGFLEPAPNTDAKKALLSGLQDFAGVAAGAAPKPETSEE
jgi:septal ring factor EnvC (AmiA/AmiB activator)